LPAAVQWYRKAAEQGNVHAARSLAVLYETGRGVHQNAAEAFKWFKKAAEGGYSKAQNDLGQRYEAGQGVTQDNAEAEKWYLRAASQNNVEAQHNLGLLYDGFTTGGVAHDAVKAYYFFSLAAAQDDKYLHDRDAMEPTLSAGQVDAAKKSVTDFFRDEAGKGDAGAEFCLGKFYLEGRGVAKDPAQADQWLQKAAMQGHAGAAAALGGLYADEGYPKKNYEAAYLWAQIAAKSGLQSQGSSVEQYLTQAQIADLKAKAAAWKPAK
jgi:TPR repeat protein